MEEKKESFTAKEAHENCLKGNYELHHQAYSKVLNDNNPSFEELKYVFSSISNNEICQYESNKFNKFGFKEQYNASMLLNSINPRLSERYLKAYENMKLIYGNKCTVEILNSKYREVKEKFFNDFFDKLVRNIPEQ